MESKRFKTLLQLKGILDKETVSELEDFNNKFPYCQTSRLLYAKALHDQNSIHYDEQLKLAAAYAPDREVLRRLIATKTEETEFEFPPRKTESSPELTAAPPGASGEPAASKPDERFQEWYSEDEISGRAFEEQKERQKTVDPHEVIRRRLNEILSGANENLMPARSPEPPTAPLPTIAAKDAAAHTPEIPTGKEAVEPVKTDAEEIVYKEDLAAEQQLEQEIAQVGPEKSAEEKKILAQAKKAQDVLDKLELEHAMEESILDSISKLPVISEEKKIPAPPPKKAEAAKGSAPMEAGESRTFTDWLKSLGKGKATGFEEVHAPAGIKAFPTGMETVAVALTEADLSDDELIEKFLLEDPKIVPSKSEFYSPVAQAKKSVMDHDDVVSETLAKIYLQQGNSQKARWCYERLMLLHPEKSAFFAALLKEIPEGNSQ